MPEPEEQSLTLDYRRLKTSRGRFPVADACLRNSDDGLAQVVFTFDDAGAHSPAPFDLETLACALPYAGGMEQADLVERIASCARSCGPLLGQPVAESATDWVCEIGIAQAALRLQQAVNGDVSLASPALPIVKSGVWEETTHVPLFTSYCVSLRSGMAGDGRLESCFPRMPWMKRFANDGGSCDYAFVCCDDSQDEHVLDIHLISFPRDVPTVDYSFMTAYFKGLGYDVSAANAEDAFPLAETPLAGRIVSDEMALNKEDAPHVQRLVHVIVALHTEGVHVDLFKADGSNDFLAFDTYISSLWYDFAMRLGSVKVGYCVQCGRGFSLTGHRGMAKEYCSESCRTQAKNERRRAQVARARELYWEGEAVGEVASAVYPEMGERAACDAIRKALRQWPALKRAIEDDLKNGDGSLTKRCVDEGAVDENWLARKARALVKRRK